MKKENQQVSERRTFKISRKVFLATLLSFFLTSLAVSLGSAIDSYVIGHTMDTAEMGACSLINPLGLVFAMIGGILSTGLTKPCMDLFARGEEKEVRTLYSTVLTFGVTVSLMLMAAILAFSYPITELLGAQPGSPVFEPCRKYVIGQTIGLPAMTLMTLFSTSAQMEGERKLPVYSVVAMTGIDIVADVVGAEVLHVGMFGMGFATALSYYAAMFVLLLHFRKPDIMLRYRPHLFRWKHLMAVFQQGLPMGVCRITNAWKCTFINRLLALNLTGVGLAAYSVQVQVNYLTNAFFMGVAQALVLQVSLYYAEEDTDALSKVTKGALKLELLIGGALALFVYTFSHPIVAFYTGNNPETAGIASLAVSVLAMCLIPQGLIVLFANYLQATGRRVVSNIVYILSDVVILYYVLDGARKMIEGMDAELYDTAIVITTFFGVLVAQIIFVLLIPVLAAIVNRKYSLRWKAFLMLKKGFGVDKDNELTAAINSVEEAVAFSEKVSEFYQKRGVSAKQAQMLALAMEEMAVNVITHGFSDGKSHLLEIRVVRKEDELILRMRDDCEYFDPMEAYHAFHHNEDPTAMIGLRLVMSLAKDVSYNSVLGLNNLMIKV